MEALTVLIPLVLVSGLAGWGCYAAWKKGYRKPVFVALGIIIALAALFFYLSSIATGPDLAGLFEALVAFAILMGPGMGVILGIATAHNRWLGIVVGLVYLGVLANTFLVIG